MKHTPDQVWDCLSDLQGLCLKTIDRHCPFTVLSVEDSCLRFQTNTSAKEHSISRDTLLQSFNILKNKRELTRTQLADSVGNGHSTYVVTLLATLPDVAVCKNPIRLIYHGSQLFYLPVCAN